MEMDHLKNHQNYLEDHQENDNKCNGNPSHRNRGYNLNKELEILCKTIIGREIANLAKLCNNKDKLVNKENSFIRKFRIFKNAC